MRRILLPISWLYALGLATRRAMYRTGIAKPYRPPVRTISVGNITVGGTGKSPLVEFLCFELERQGCNVVAVRRSRAGFPSGADLSDEEKVFAENLPDTQQVSEKNKADCVKQACALKPDVVIVDDGFQTISLERDFDIVTIDATSPFGNGYLLPAGTLREPPGALRRADAVVLTQCDETKPAEKDSIVEKLRRLTNAEIFEARYVANEIMTLGGSSMAPSAISGKKVFAFCGIGSPAGFVRTLERLGCAIVGRRVFRDHYVYSTADVHSIEKESEDCGADMIMTTQKDAVRLRSLERAEREIYYLKIHLDVTNGDTLCRLAVSE